MRFVLPILLFCCLSPRLPAQDLEPRTYTNIPVGQNFLGVGYAYSDGEIDPSPSVPLRDIEITMKTYPAAYVRSLDLWGKAGKFDAAWARLCMDGSGFINEPVRRRRPLWDCGSYRSASATCFMVRRQWT